MQIGAGLGETLMGRKTMEKRPSLSVGGMFGLIGVEVEHGIRSQPFPRHVATDSRDVKRGGAFVALEGERTDGHRYIPQALENGASLMVVRRGKRPADPLVPCVELEDPERDLARLASEYLRRVEPREVVAVTGSVEKTTTREALRRVLETRFRVHSATRSLNTRIGCTATVLAMPSDAELLSMLSKTNEASKSLDAADDIGDAVEDVAKVGTSVIRAGFILTLSCSFKV